MAATAYRYLAPRDRRISAAVVRGTNDWHDSTREDEVLLPAASQGRATIASGEPISGGPRHQRAGLLDRRRSHPALAGVTSTAFPVAGLSGKKLPGDTDSRSDRVRQIGAAHSTGGGKSGQWPERSVPHIHRRRRSQASADGAMMDTSPSTGRGLTQERAETLFDGRRRQAAGAGRGLRSERFKSRSGAS